MKVALRKYWTKNSRVYDHGPLPGARRKISVDHTNSAQNMQFPDGSWHTINPRLVPSDKPGFRWMTKRTPYAAYIATDGTRRIYPNRFETNRFLEFPAAGFLADRLFADKGDVTEYEKDGVRIRNEFHPTRIPLDIHLSKPAAFSSAMFPMIRRNISRKRAARMFNRLTVYNDEESRPIDILVENDYVLLSWDVSGMSYPLVIDPTIDPESGESDDNGYHRLQDDVTHVFSQVAVLLGRTSNRVWGGYSRFPGIVVPAESEITAATIKYTSSANRTGETCRVIVQAAASDNEPIPVDDAAWHTMVASLTTANVPWTVPTMLTDVSATSPDITTVVQEVIDRPGWNAEQAIMIIILDGGSDVNAYRNMRWYGHAGVPVLHIEYNEPSAGGSRVHLSQSGMSTANI